MVKSAYMISAMNKLTDGTIELTITVPWSEIQKTYTAVVDEAVSNAEVSGFRKGKAPKALVEKSLDKTKMYEEVVKRIVPQVYSDAVKEQKIHPIVMPKIELKEATENKDWVIKGLTCEKPLIILEDYKKKIAEIKSSKQKKIWLPGEKPEPEKDLKDKKPNLDEILKALFEAVKITIPAILSENETNRLLSDLIDQTKKIGLTVDQYLASTHKTAESIRSEYALEANRTLTLEFALEEIADKEGILISDDEIDNTINNAKSETEKAAMQKERYYIASILRRQKTLDFLASI
jgi:FKBP-type peptidyl-prolyl cis-trans isomerase (trigger factor)